MASMPLEARHTPSVPPTTMMIAGMLKKDIGDVPSIIAPPSKPKVATPIPIAVAAFMGVLSCSSADAGPSSPCDDAVGRTAAGVRAGEDAGAPLLDAGHDRLDALDHHDLGPSGEG